MHLGKHRRRRGAVAVEFAFVAIPLFVFFFASVEFCRSLMAMNTLEEAAREGCRVAILKGATTANVEEEVEGLMRVAGVVQFDVQIEPATFEQLEQWSPISLTITAPYDEISWLPAPLWLRDTTFSASCTLPKECSPSE
jgi:hypothetical protein